MKKIIHALAVTVITTVAIALSGCHNRPPFLVLQESVDSVNTYLSQQPEQTAPAAKILYDDVTNSVVFMYKLPDSRVADFTRDNIAYTEDIYLKDVLPGAPADLMKNIVDAQASVVLDYRWPPKGHAEYLIEADRVKQAYEEYTRDR